MELFFLWAFGPRCFWPWEVTAALGFEPVPDDEGTEGTVLAVLLQAARRQARGSSAGLFGSHKAPFRLSHFEDQVFFCVYVVHILGRH